MVRRPFFCRKIAKIFQIFQIWGKVKAVILSKGIDGRQGGFGGCPPDWREIGGWQGGFGGFPPDLRWKCVESYSPPREFKKDGFFHESFTDGRFQSSRDRFIRAPQRLQRSFVDGFFQIFTDDLIKGLDHMTIPCKYNPYFPTGFRLAS